jgi:cytochrome c oxidase subunit 3
VSAHVEPKRERPPFLAVHFENLAIQTETAKFGMWIFLASEILFFGGLFAAYAVYRGNHPDMFHYGQYFLDWRLGGLNTLVLISSSLSAAWSVRCAQRRDRRGLTLTLLLTIVLASAFMVVKYTEYMHKIHTGLVWGAHFNPTPEAFEHLPAAARALPVPAHMGIFFSIYFIMTGLHGIHVLVGMGLYGWLLRRTLRGDFDGGYYAPVDVVALYWHLVDMIWIYLFPLLYLIG